MHSMHRSEEAYMIASSFHVEHADESESGLSPEPQVITCAYSTREPEMDAA